MDKVRVLCDGRRTGLRWARSFKCRYLTREEARQLQADGYTITVLLRWEINHTVPNGQVSKRNPFTPIQFAGEPLDCKTEWP